jgi:hypothetical protein
VLAVAVAVAAPYLGPIVGGALFTAAGTAAAAGSFAAIAGTALVGVALSAVSFGVMSLFSQPAVSPAGGTGFNGSTPASSPVYNLTAQGNYARLGQPIPEPMGRNRLFPDFVTTPYARYPEVDPLETPGTVASTNDQYLHHILALGIGEYSIDSDSLKLGDTPISTYEDIEWAIIEPGDLPDLDYADERWITATDLAQIELLDVAEGSPWAGPFAANPPQTTIDTIEIDIAAPRGLWAFNMVSSDIDARQFEVEYEAQLIDDLGAGIGSWETFDTVLVNRRSQDVQRVTIAEIALPTAGRWQVRVRRIDTKDTALNAGHQVDWIGLRGRVVGRRTFPGMTCISLKMKAGEALNSAQSRQFNLVATRKLETWDAMAGAMGAVKAATRSPCDAFAYIARTSNGGRLPDSRIGLEALYAHKAEFESNDWTFDFVFDSGLTVSEALARVARAVIAERVVQGGILDLVRDTEPTAPVAMFSPRNIVAGSFTKSYQMPDSTAPDAIIGTYIDQSVWRPIDVTVAFDDSAQERPTRVTLHGVGNRDQAREVLWHMAREDRYRRKVNGWSTGMEGLAVTYGDGISFSHDVPNYGQSLEVIDHDDTDPNAPIFTVADIPDFSTGGATYYALVRDNTGFGAGPFVAAPVEGAEDQIQLTVPDPGDLPEILIGGEKERTWLQLGPGEAYAKPLKVKQVTPRGDSMAEIIAYDDDPRMYDAIPEEPDVPIGGDLDPLTVVVTTSGNLRTKANAAGYSGLAVQQVTFTVAIGVDVWLIRGSWPSGAEPIIELAGTLSGGNGAAGAAGAGGAAYVPGPAGNGRDGGTGGTGGTALDSSTGALVITGTGTIRGGKGGGGGGGGGGSTVLTDGEGTPIQTLAGGAGGAGNGGTGSSGETSGGYAAGTGGNGGALATDYGSAGSAGSAGGTGTLDGTGTLYPGGAGGAGGDGGKAIVGVANVDLSGFGGLTIGTTS